MTSEKLLPPALCEPVAAQLGAAVLHGELRAPEPAALPARADRSLTRIVLETP